MFLQSLQVTPPDIQHYLLPYAAGNAVRSQPRSCMVRLAPYSLISRAAACSLPRPHRRSHVFAYSQWLSCPMTRDWKPVPQSRKTSVRGHFAEYLHPVPTIHDHWRSIAETLSHKDVWSLTLCLARCGLNPLFLLGVQRVMMISMSGERCHSYTVGL